MGLDMYLFRFPRIGDITPRQMDSIFKYVGYKRAGYPDSYVQTRYPEIFNSIPHGVKWRNCVAGVDNLYDLQRNVAYWRKAPHIHNWFVKRVQNGEDDCRIHDEVTPDILRDLFLICKRVIARTDTSHIYTRYLQAGATDSVMESLEYALDSVDVADLVADHLPLPSCCNTLGGGYDEYYMEQVFYTAKMCAKLYSETDFENEMLAYLSSW